MYIYVHMHILASIFSIKKRAGAHVYMYVHSTGKSEQQSMLSQHVYTYRGMYVHRRVCMYVRMYVCIYSIMQYIYM